MTNLVPRRIAIALLVILLLVVAYASGISEGKNTQYRTIAEQSEEIDTLRTKNKALLDTNDRLMGRQAMVPYIAEQKGGK